MRTLIGRRSIGRLSVSLEFKWQDLWVGVFVRQNDAVGGDAVHQAWVCLLPMIPLHLWWRV